jgi:hypothetical protein
VNVEAESAARRRFCRAGAPTRTPSVAAKKTGGWLKFANF